MRSLHGKGIPRTLRSIHGRVNYQKIAFYTEQSGVSEHCVLYMEEGILRTLLSIHDRVNYSIRKLRSIQSRVEFQSIAFYTWKRGFSEHYVLYMEEGILRTLRSIHGRVDSQNIAF